MGNAWRSLEALNDSIVIGAYDELVRHAPMKDGRVDPVRPAADIRGVLHTPTVDGMIVLQGMQTTISGAAAALVVSRASYPNIVFRKGDKIRATDRPGSPGWEVAKVSDRFTSILVVELNESS